jgi:hypothetical protein
MLVLDRVVTIVAEIEVITSIAMIIGRVGVAIITSICHILVVLRVKSVTEVDSAVFGTTHRRKFL